MEDQMKIELMDTIQLEDNRKYIVASTSIVNKIKYYLLINDEIETDIVIGYVDGNELVMIDDTVEFSKILSTFDYEKLLNKFGDIFLDDKKEQ